ncbi:hypothetical protein F5Y17DRAFT_223980 [Xylariaceae sp. FL0594]|nr:hypothetical protein F5Y17DRAFT_223980 [Xylariaceae sp. FL0594]
MTNGLEKLERLFSGSRRRERGRSKTTQKQQKAPVASIRQPSSPIFPSPSYLRPTSMHMTPRDPQIDKPEKDKSRSYSVPTIRQALIKRSSGASSITVVARQPSRPLAPASSPGHRNRDSQATSQIARFRFPEDSLFKGSRRAGSPDEAETKYLSRDPSPRACAAELPSESSLSDWNPKPISCLFNPLDFATYANGDLQAFINDGAESTLLPSPEFAPSTLLSDKYDKAEEANLLSEAFFPQSKCHSVQKLTLSLRQQSLLHLGQPNPDSSPASDREQEIPSFGIRRSSSLSATFSPCSSRPDTPLMPSSAFRRGRIARETWGNRFQDLRLRHSSERLSEVVTNATPLRNSASTSTLSLLEYQLGADNVLSEPSFDDFYSLSDDDIAESLPPVAVFDCRAPPTPSPKFQPRPSGKSQLQLSLASQSAVSGHPPGELTPPCTPITLHFIARPYSPIASLATVGVQLAAELART